MDNRLKKLMNDSYDKLYDLKFRFNNKFYSKIDLFLDDIEAEAKEWGYEFKLNQKSQKFRLLKIK